MLSTGLYENAVAFNVPPSGTAGLATSTIDIEHARWVATSYGVVLVVTHTFPDDLDMLLVAPDGVHNLEFWSDAGGGNANALSNVPVVIEDGGASPLPDGSLIGSFQHYKPADYNQIEPGSDFGYGGTVNHAGPNGGSTFASAFAGLSDPNGVWKLDINDDSVGDAGSVGAWGVFFTGQHFAVTNNDTDGNFRSDVIWRDGAGHLVTWDMNGGTIAGGNYLTSNGAAVAVDSSWNVAGIADFNGDHNSDILWRNDNGALAEWLMNGSTIASSVTPTSDGNAVTPDASWTTQAKPTNFA